MAKREAAAGRTGQPPDQVARDRIVGDLDRTLLVEAAAGTGKTTSLVGRMVALIREGRCTPDTLAAVTFTRNAAAQLRARFLSGLEREAGAASGEARDRLDAAVAGIDRAFLGTIHSFCGQILRERPVEAGVGLGFRELDEVADDRLRRRAWDDHVAALHADADPILAELDELGLHVGQLRDTFLRFADYPDVADWPAEPAELGDLGPAIGALRGYADHMEEIARSFGEPGNDKLMPRYRLIPRQLRQADPDRIADLMEILATIGELSNKAVIQKCWPGGKTQALAELDRWNEFAASHAVPLTDRWLAGRYEACLRAIRPAVATYDRCRRQAGALNFQDLLIGAARLLRERPEVRAGLRGRFTHVLVDEFQDTDPVQAEVLCLLTADDPAERDWKRCRPAPGSLFVVGDPKQSIYRFRRADIATYDRVKALIVAGGGEVLPLTTSFRTVGPLIRWANEVFATVFPATSSEHAPEHRPMDVGRPESGPAASIGLRTLTIPEEHGTNEEAVAHDAARIARMIHHAIELGLELPRAGREADDGDTPKARPGDFLIVTWKTKHLTLYARTLAGLGLPCTIVGGAGLNESSELALLLACLRAATRPDDPLALVAALRGEAFGISDAGLYAYRKAGGRFSFRAPPVPTVDGETTAIEEAKGRIKQHASWLRRLPPVPAIERIAADLGLVARAAAAGRAGSLLRAFELLRDVPGSAADLVRELGRIVDREERHDDVPSRPHEAPGVRVMNLHKVKGLEASVVFLADPTGHSTYPVQLHIDRSSGAARGYLAVLEESSGRAPDALIARPFGWETWMEREKLFLDAEAHRLLYVAATRGGAQLVLSRRSKGDHRNPWKFFAGHLADAIEIDDFPGLGPGSAGCPEVSAAERAVAAAARDDRWRLVREPTYFLGASKADSLADDGPGPAGEGKGAGWGSVIHRLLEARSSGIEPMILALATRLLIEEGLDPARAGEAAEVVASVARSTTWARALACPKRMVEVPFEVLRARADGKSVVVRGVIDLAFLEPRGWVVVDYKTDSLSGGRLDALVEHYRPQVGDYAETWASMTGQAVAESGLHFTEGNRYIVVT